MPNFKFGINIQFNPSNHYGYLWFSMPSLMSFAYTFFSVSPKPSFLFFAFALFFLPLRSLFFSPCIPALQTSAYRTKKASSLSASTTVDNLILSARWSFDLPLLARMRTGSGEAGFRSGNDASVDGEAGGGEAEESIWRTKHCGKGSDKLGP